MKQNFSTLIDGKDTDFNVKQPNLVQQREAQKIYNQSFSDAVKSGSIVRARLDDLLKEQGLWDDNKEARFAAIQQEISNNEKILAVGGISLNQAKSIALEMKELREELKKLISVKTNLDTHTAEGQADNARFNYLVSASLVYKDSNKSYFKNYEDYINRSSETVAILGAQILAAMMYGLDSEFERKLPENKFLLDYKFIDDQFRLINKEGKFVDAEGKLVDENGRYINEDSQFVDKDGSLVDEAGEYVVDFKPFTDDHGKPVILDKKEDTKDTKDAKEDTNEPKAESSE